MVIRDNGIIREMTPEEITEMELMQSQIPAPAETIDRRMGSLETDVKQMKSEMGNLGYILTGKEVV